MTLIYLADSLPERRNSDEEDPEDQVEAGEDSETKQPEPKHKIHLVTQ